jgi:hypothetical protein
MTIMSIDVQATDADGNIVASSTSVLVNDSAAAAERLPAGDELTMEQRRAHLLGQSISYSGTPPAALSNEAIDTALTPAGKPLTVTQAQKSQTLAKFTGGYR